MKPLLREIGRAAAVLLGVLLCTFLLFHWLGGDPARRALGPHASPETLAQLRSGYGLDRPLPEQFAGYLRDMAVFRFGRSFHGQQDVAGLLLRALPNTLALTVPAFLGGTLLALLLAAWPLWWRSSGLAVVLDLGSAALMSLPFLFLVIAAQYFLGYRLGLFPISGGSAAGYLLPVLLLTAVNAGYDYRYYRGVLARHSGGDYLTAALARGVPYWRVVLFHLLPNCAPSIVTRLIVAVPFLFTGSLLLENFFQLRGVGAVLVEAAFGADWPVLRAATWLISLLFVLLHWAGDALCRRLDPRRLTEEAGDV